MDIEPDEISDSYDTGLVVLAYAATVAPCLDSLDNLPRAKAVAILRRVAGELPGTGMSRVSQQSRNGTSVSFRDVGDVFTANDRSALRALCGISPSAAAAPVGSFPTSGLVAAIWPESS
ncbi:hypothetical protein H5399_05080 [Tessaracoccus sp. MC1627]|uniref:hypothetical protein n=1 Tax=Tessaracoccus sp. MC1627 TaxID=2760312 RepID=UPI0015FF740F|nr:hypothetical protein [Tessaracoccus sp. MC1627]MBB1511977.1 hypothetical protein [Tessaracoccus sp. MC1627]